MNQLPECFRQVLFDTPETGSDLHVVNLRLQNGRLVRDVAILHCSIIACVRGRPFVWFTGTDVAALEVTHRRWGAPDAAGPASRS